MLAIPIQSAQTKLNRKRKLGALPRVPLPPARFLFSLPCFLSQCNLSGAVISHLELLRRLSTQNHGTKPPDPILDSDSDDSDSDSDDSSDYSSTDSDDDDENSENRQACRRIFDHIDADGSGLVELDEVLDSWQQCTTVR